VGRGQTPSCGFSKSAAHGFCSTVNRAEFIEIVNKLIELKLLDVVFTSDGKKYITPEKLNKEILDELYINGGRLSLVDLSSALNISITARVTEFVKSERNIHFVLGHLVTTIDRIYEELENMFKSLKSK